MLKIHWQLKNHIKISLNDSQVNANEVIHNKQDNFKATSVRDLNEKKCWDDSSLLRNASLSDDSLKKQSLRSQSVKYKPNKWKRTQLSNMNPTESIQENLEEEVNFEFIQTLEKSFFYNLLNKKEQMFIPSYGSMSSICIESQTFCSSAIKILLEKFHVSFDCCYFFCQKLSNIKSVNKLF